MKKLFVFAAAFIAFTGFTFSGKNDVNQSYSSAITDNNVQDMFSSFRLHRQAKNVVLNWSVTNPSGSSGFTVERSYDGDFYEVISQVSCNSSVRYSWKDENVFPGVIYYRIGCMMNDGYCHYSTIESIRIVQRG